MIRLFLSSILLSSFIAFPLYASPKDELDQTKKAMEQSRTRQTELAEKAKGLAEERRQLQDALVDLAQSIQASETALSAAEEKLELLSDKLKAKEDSLAEHRQQLAALVQAALRLSRIPPEAMVMMPGDTFESVKAAHALKMTADSIRREANLLGLQMAELKHLKEKLAKNRDELAKRQASLDEERRALERKLAERKALEDQLGHEQKEEASRQAALARKAEDLEGLIASLNQPPPPPSIELKPEDYVSEAPKAKGRLRSFASAKGRLRPPVAGTVVQFFGAGGARDTAKGIVIATRRGAAVTAPFDGEVVFTGPFRGYGQLVILRHADGFHTLLAGLKKIDAQVGQFLLEGEPIGAMGDSGFGDKSDNRLYVELRRNNQPVDPAPWIHGLNQ